LHEATPQGRGTRHALDGFHYEGLTVAALFSCKADELFLQLRIESHFHALRLEIRANGVNELLRMRSARILCGLAEMEEGGVEAGSGLGAEAKWKRRARASMGAFWERMWATMVWIFSVRAILEEAGD